MFIPFGQNPKYEILEESNYFIRNKPCRPIEALRFLKEKDKKIADEILEEEYKKMDPEKYLKDSIEILKDVEII